MEYDMILSKKVLRALGVFSLVAALGGCAGMASVYDSDFSCPNSEKGMCGSVETAHGRALDETKNKKNNSLGNIRSETELEDDVSTPIPDKDFDSVLKEMERCAKNGDSKCVAKKREQLAAIYQTAEDVGREREQFKLKASEQKLRLEALEQYVKASKNAPVRTGQRVMETVVLPYKSDFGALVGERTLWVVVEDGEWVWQINNKKTVKVGLGNVQ